MINVITEPKIRLVGRQQIVNTELDQFLADEDVSAWTTDTEIAGEKLVEVAGRLCYKSYAKPRPGGNAKYLEHILEVGHGSVCEHAVYNFIITGVSRSFTHELIRHRAGWGYSQRSQRFVDEGDLDAVVPPALVWEVAEGQRAIDWYRKEKVIEPWDGAKALLNMAESCDIEELDIATAAGLRWLALMEQSRRDYSYLTDYLSTKILPPPTNPGQPLPSQEQRTAVRKRAREAARSVLPNATETQIFVTANARALRGMIEQRGVPGADAEMRRVAVAMAKIMMAEAPNLFCDYSISGDGDGEYVQFRYRKV